MTPAPFPRCQSCHCSFTTLTPESASRCPACGSVIDWAAARNSPNDQSRAALLLMFTPQAIMLLTLLISPGDREGRNSTIALLVIFGFWFVAIVTGVFGMDLLLPPRMRFRNLAVIVCGLLVGLVPPPLIAAFASAIGLI